MQQYIVGSQPQFIALTQLYPHALSFPPPSTTEVQSGVKVQHQGTFNLISSLAFYEKSSLPDPVLIPIFIVSYKKIQNNPNRGKDSNLSIIFIRKNLKAC